MPLWTAGILCVLGVIGAVLSILQARRNKLYALIAAVCLVLALAAGFYIAAALWLLAGL